MGDVEPDRAKGRKMYSRLVKQDMEQTLNGAPADRGAHFSKKNISDC